MTGHHRPPVGAPGTNGHRTNPQIWELLKTGEVCFEKDKTLRPSSRHLLTGKPRAQPRSAQGGGGGHRVTLSTIRTPRADAAVQSPEPRLPALPRSARKGSKSPPATSSQRHPLSRPPSLRLPGPYPEACRVGSGKRHWQVQELLSPKSGSGTGGIRNAQNPAHCCPRLRLWAREGAHRAWEKGLEQAEAGIRSRSARGTGLAPEPGSAEGRPSSNRWRAPRSDARREAHPPLLRVPGPVAPQQRGEERPKSIRGEGGRKEGGGSSWRADGCER